MTRAQIQIPDGLYRAAKHLCETKEMSLAELCRRGIEYMLRLYPHPKSIKKNWTLPKPRPLGGSNPFADPDWRLKANFSSRDCPRVEWTFELDPPSPNHLPRRPS